jgi:membrane associated rhomboid family serine protease
VTTKPSEGGAAGVPVCPRHPARESYVRCQRCERPTCPECQRPAAVGIQCVDCVRQQAKGTRVARTPFGGAIVGTAAPRVTQTIIGLCVAAFVLQKLPGSTVTQNYEFAPVYASSEPWRLLTAAFLHAPNQLLHIALNMYALWLTGPYLEALFGRVRFALLYLISAIGGSVGYLLLANPESNQWFVGTVGASGAVFGLFGAYFVVQHRLSRGTAPLITIILINFAFGFIVPGIAWQAHLGGLITGLLASAALAYAPKANRTRIQAAGVAAVVVLLGVVYAVKIASVPAGLLA